MATGGLARKEKTIRRTNNEHIHVDAQIFPTTAALCATDLFLPRDGSPARKRPRGLWEGNFPVACNAGIQAKFDLALAMLHAFSFSASAKTFMAVALNAFAVQSRAYIATFDSLGADGLVKVPAFIVHSEMALAPALARRFIANLAGPHEELWLSSRGQIEFYDQAALMDAAADTIVDYFARILSSPIA
jgi:hypothetical protein